MTDATAGTGSPNSDRCTVNFFKPQSPHAREDMRIILTLFIIWAVAVFGFQFLLVALNQDTPEQAYIQYETVWPKVEAGSATVAEKQIFARTILSVLGKNIALSSEHKITLQQALGIVILDLLPADKHERFNKLVEAAADKGNLTPAVRLAAQAIDLKSTGMDKVMGALLPSSLVVVQDTQYSSALPETMKRYLIHNQNVLTDFKFIGFPFHYWYTAQFLLILFVVLCLVYVVVIERINKKHGFEEK
ncbi:DUF4212 domain-containing protein [Oligoflexia bacterium]|nr:DUF4212 domain-containing protein [Oligoflexia bacterium]